MTPLLRSALGVLLLIVCLVVAWLCAIHGILVGSLIALIAAALFAWAVYDNRRLALERQRQDGAEPTLDAPRDDR